VDRDPQGGYFAAGTEETRRSPVWREYGLRVPSRTRDHAGLARGEFAALDAGKNRD
jgi:hypothetical protein